MINCEILVAKAVNIVMTIEKKAEYRKGFFLPYRSDTYPDTNEPIKNPINTMLAYKLCSLSVRFHSFFNIGIINVKTVI